MKTNCSLQVKRPAMGFTLVEMMVAMAISCLCGGMIFSVLNGITVLYAKNTSINSAHQQMVTALQRVTRDIHASISSPELVDVNRAATNGPAAGVSVQPIVSGPFNLVSLSPLSGKVTILTGSAPPPAVGQRIVCPTCLIEDFITAVAPNSAHPATQTDLSLAQNVWTAAALTNTIYAPVFITNRSAYVVTDGELRYYPVSTGSNNDSYSVLARGVGTATPFNLLNNGAGAAGNVMVNGTLAVAEPRYNRRGFRATDILVNFRVPYRSRLAATP